MANHPNRAKSKEENFPIPIGTWLHGTYCGTIARLVGKTAILQSDPDRDGWFLAQFDDTKTKLGYGWHPFLVNEFTLDEEKE